MALKRALGVLSLTWGQAVDLGGLAQGPPDLNYLDAIFASLFSARSFSCLSGSVAISKATIGQDFDPLGRPLRLGRSAGPKSPSGMWDSRWPLRPHGSAKRDEPGAVDGPSSMDDDNEDEERDLRLELLHFPLTVWRFLDLLDGQNFPFDEEVRLEWRAWPAEFGFPRQAWRADGR